MNLSRNIAALRNRGFAVLVSCIRRDGKVARIPVVTGTTDAPRYGIIVTIEGERFGLFMDRADRMRVAMR